MKNTNATHIIVRSTNQLRWAFPDQVFTTNILPYIEHNATLLDQYTIEYYLAKKDPGGELRRVSPQNANG